MGLCFIARFAIGNRAVGLYVPVFKNRMNALARTADTVTDAAGHSGMKNDNFK
ncbi:amino acid ABC transporter substrate-binding protein, partial [Klebsiella pneumoniae]